MKQTVKKLPMDITVKKIPKEMIKKANSLREEHRTIEDDYINAKNKFEESRANFINSFVDIAKYQVEDAIAKDFELFYMDILEDRSINLEETLENYYLNTVRSVRNEIVFLNKLLTETPLKEKALPKDIKTLNEYLLEWELDNLILLGKY